MVYRKFKLVNGVKPFSNSKEITGDGVGGCRCGPCQLMVPILEEVSASMKDKIQVVKLDTEKYPNIANKYRIAALPTFILFKDGEPSDRIVSQLFYSTSSHAD